MALSRVRSGGWLSSGRPSVQSDGDLVTPRRIQRRRQPAILNMLLRMAIPAALVLLWILAADGGWVSQNKLPPPGGVWSAFTHLLDSGQLWSNFWASFKRAAEGFLFGTLVALPLAMIAGLSRLGDQLVDAPMQMLRTVPFLALAPLTTIWLGIGDLQKIVMISWACAIPIYINAYGGVRSVDGKLLEAAHVYGVSRLETIRSVVFPAALPQILIGFRYAIGISLIALIFVEQTNAPQGIGSLMTNASDFFETNVVIVLIIVYALWGLFGDLLVRGLEWSLLPWRRGAAPNQ
jgi:sulfonate transport system permease protein